MSRCAASGASARWVGAGWPVGAAARYAVGRPGAVWVSSPPPVRAPGRQCARGRHTAVKCPVTASLPDRHASPGLRPSRAVAEAATPRPSRALHAVASGGCTLRSLAESVAWGCAGERKVCCVGALQSVPVRGAPV